MVVCTKIYIGDGAHLSNTFSDSKAAQVHLNKQQLQKQNVHDNQRTGGRLARALREILQADIMGDTGHCVKVNGTGPRSGLLYS